MDLLSEDAGRRPDGAAGGLVEALLREVAERLARLSATGEDSVIDLTGLPMAAADRAALAERLGTGEVAASLDVAGASDIRETAYAGVWWVRHRGAGGKIAAERLEIAAIPDILRAHPDDISLSADRLADQFDNDKPQ